MTLTAVSLFAGIEGIGLALHRAGVDVTAAVEIDDAARGVIAEHFLHTILLTDVTKVSADDLRATGFDPDRGIVAAGWPCQGNSVAGRRGGMADPRSGLWMHVARLLAELRPRWFLGENVPGLLSVNGGRDFAAVIGDLADLGYGYAWRVLDAQHFGVPQRRRRVFIVGRVGDRAAPVQVLLEPEGGGGDSAPRRASGQDVAGTLGSRFGDSRTTDLDGYGAYVPYTVHSAESCAQERHAFPTEVARSLDTTGGFATNQGGTVVAYALRADPGGTGQGHNTNYITHTLTGRSAVEEDGTGRGVPVVTHALTAEGADASEDGTGRDTPLVAHRDIAQSLTANYGKQPDNSDTNLGPTLIGDATAVRRLTPLECERLQGFPDGWTATSNGKPQSDSARYRQLGNAVAVPCVEWIAKRIVHADALTRAGP